MDLASLELASDLASVGTELPVPPEMRSPPSEMRSEMRSPPSRKGTEYSDDLEGDRRGADAISDDEEGAEMVRVCERCMQATEMAKSTGMSWGLMYGT